jgi:hypothetical protein
MIDQGDDGAFQLVMSVAAGELDVDAITDRLRSAIRPHEAP